VIGCTATTCANCGWAAATGAFGVCPSAVAVGSSPGGNGAVAAEVAMVMLAGVASACVLFACPHPVITATATMPSDARTARVRIVLRFIVLSRPKWPLMTS